MGGAESRTSGPWLSGQSPSLSGPETCQDPTLRRFLVDGPAILAGLRIQHSFELQFTKEQCEAFIESYAALGGDSGMTEDAMRQACALAPSDTQLLQQRPDLSST